MLVENANVSLGHLEIVLESGATARIDLPSSYRSTPSSGMGLLLKRAANRDVCVVSIAQHEEASQKWSIADVAPGHLAEGARLQHVAAAAVVSRGVDSVAWI